MDEKTQYLYEVGKTVSDDFEKRSAGQDEERKKVFYCHRPSAFQINFPNGAWASSIWGFGAMAEGDPIRKTRPDDTELNWGHALYRQFGSNTVEVMYDSPSQVIIKKIEKRFGKENPLGHLSFPEWLWLINTLASGRRKQQRGVEK